LNVDDKGYAVLMDRKYTIVYLKARVYTSALQGTAFDVELLHLPDQTFLILIFDTLSINGNNVTKFHYLSRLELARQFLHNIVKVDKAVNFSTHEPQPGSYPSRFPDIQISNGEYKKITTKMQVKQVYYSQSLHGLKSTPHYPTDGFIWTLGNIAYSPFRSKANCVFKWKPIALITVDFFVRPSPNETIASIVEIPLSYRQSSGVYGLFASTDDGLVLVSKFDSDTTLHGVYEFSWSGIGWSLKQHRPDKVKPNQLNTVIHTIDNITENIALSDIKPQ
jgi:hypothetical protein